MKRLALAMAVTGVVALAPLAQAADLKAAPAAIDPGYNWTGFYAGIHAGMGFADNQFFDVIGGTDAAVADGSAGSSCWTSRRPSSQASITTCPASVAGDGTSVQASVARS